jgi:hypothetical protein
MSPTAIEVDMKGATITDVSGAFLLGELVTGLQRRGHTVKVVNALPDCRVQPVMYLQQHTLRSLRVGPHFFSYVNNQELLLKSHVPAEAVHS